MGKYGIVVVGYNRLGSLKRLLNSLKNAIYNETIDLIISLDNSDNKEVYEFSNNFKWEFGLKKVILSKEKLGLRNHIIKCGNYLNEFNYDAIIMLEDDLYVSPDFFNYSKQAIDFYKDDMRVAGISLYQHLWNVNANRPFNPIISNDDVFFMQYAQSWGQIWLKKQWNDFYKWYLKKEYTKVNKINIPENVLKWPESSWLKYHIQYCIEQNKYFIYPYYGLTTNFADVGTHYSFSTNNMQIPLILDNGKKYIFSKFDDSNVVYDAYFENVKLGKYLDIPECELSVDLYGTKNNNKRYLLTMNKLPYKIIKKFALKMRPHEMNIIFDISGDDIMLYDTEVKSKIHLSKADVDIIKFNYDLRGMLHTFKIVKILIYKVIRRLKLYNKSQYNSKIKE